MNEYKLARMHVADATGTPTMGFRPENTKSGLRRTPKARAIAPTDLQQDTHARARAHTQTHNTVDFPAPFGPTTCVNFNPDAWCRSKEEEEEEKEEEKEEEEQEEKEEEEEEEEDRAVEGNLCLICMQLQGDTQHMPRDVCIACSWTCRYVLVCI